VSSVGGRFETVYCEENAAEALRFHCSRQWTRRNYLITGAIFSVTFFFIFWGRSEASTGEDWVPSVALSLFVGTALCGAIWLANRFTGKRQIQSWLADHKLEGAVCRFEYDEDKLTITDPMFGGELKWQDAYGWTEDENFILIYRSPTFYYYVPKASVSQSDVENIVRLMQSVDVKKL